MIGFNKIFREHVNKMQKPTHLFEYCLMRRG